MDFITITLAVLLISMPTIFLLKRLIKYFKKNSQIEKLPGPQWYPVVGTSTDMVRQPLSRFFELFHDRCVQYWPGPFRTWIGPTAVVHILKPEHIEIVVASQKHITKSRIYKNIEPWLGTGLLTSTGAKWHSHRKMITPAFHFKILDIFMEVFVERSNLLVKILREKATGEIFDVYPYITKCALDIICETAMGVRIDAQTKGETDYIKAIYDVSELAVKRTMVPWYRFSDLIWNYSVYGKRYQKCIEILHKFTNEVIQDRKRARENEINDIKEDEDIGTKKRMAFLDLLLESSVNGTILTDEEIREEVDTFMFEGHDTTTAAICWSLFLLGNHPEVQEKIHQELDDIFQNSDRPITKFDIANMKYLEMVIKETLRLYPSVPFIGRTLGEDANIGGYIIPKGTIVSLHIYEAQRDPSHYENPNSFNPENFSSDNITKRHPYAFIPFSAGPRNCIGQKFAILEEKIVLASILRNYRIKSMENVEDCKKVGFLILRPANGVKITLEPRKFGN